MKKSYDFSKGTRGKFSRKDVQLNIPVYLDSETLSLAESMAAKQNTDVSTIVNQLLKTEIQLTNHTK